MSFLLFVSFRLLYEFLIIFLFFVCCRRQKRLLKSRIWGWTYLKMVDLIQSYVSSCVLTLYLSKFVIHILILIILVSTMLMAFSLGKVVALQKRTLLLLCSRICQLLVSLVTIGKFFIYKFMSESWSVFMLFMHFTEAVNHFVFQILTFNYVSKRHCFCETVIVTQLFYHKLRELEYFLICPLRNIALLLTGSFWLHYL